MNISSVTSSSIHRALQLAADQLSSGKRITSAAVDPSGLAIATALSTQANGFDQAASNARRAVNASTVAQGTAATISDAAQRLQTLAVAANNGLLSAGDRANLQSQADQNAQEIDSIVARSSSSGGAGALGPSNIDLSTCAAATTSESSVDAAITAIGTSQAVLGSRTVALQFDQQNSENTSNNLTASASNIADADITKTATFYTNQQETSQIQMALQVQAGLAASSLLGLFGGRR